MKRGARFGAKALCHAGERGFALLVVLWVVASAALMVSSFNASVRGGASLATSELGLSQLDAIVDAGIEIAVARLIDEDVDRRWIADGTVHTITFGGVDLAIRIDDPNGLIDLNKAAGPLLLQLLSHFSGAGGDAEHIRDQILLARQESSSKAAKRQRETRVKRVAQDAPPPPPSELQEIPRTVAFLDINQLRHLAGMTSQLFSIVAPFVTVHAKDGRLNAGAAPQELLDAISAADAAAREGQQQPSAGGTSVRTSAAQPMRPASTQARDIATGPAYIITVEARRPNGALGTGKRAVVALGLDSDAPYRVVSLQVLSGAGGIKP